jgi:hypothetical protein
VAIADRGMVEPSLRRGELVGLPLVPGRRRVFHAVWRKLNPRGLPVEELVEQIRAAGVERVEGRSRRRRAALSRRG